MAKRKRLNRRVALVVGLLVLVVVGSGIVFYVYNLPKDPSYYVSQAESKLQESPPNYGDALRLYSQAVNATTHNAQEAEYYLKMAQVLLDQVDNDPSLSRPKRQEAYSQALGLLRNKALVEDPTLLEARKLLAEHYWGFATRSMQRARRGEISNTLWTTTKDYIDQADEILEQEEDPEIYSRRGTAKATLAQREPLYADQALADLRKAVDLEPTTLRYWNALAYYLMELDKEDQAEDVFRQAIEENPDKAQPLVNYSAYLKEQDKSQEALAAIRRAIQVEPDNTVGYIALADYYLDRRQAEQAQQALQQALQVEKTDVRVYHRLSVLQQRVRRDYKAAAEILQQGLEVIDERQNETRVEQLRTEQARALLNYWLADVQLDRYAASDDPAVKKATLQQARECYNQLVRLTPGRPQTRQIAGRIAYVEGDWETARQELEEALQGGGNMRTALLLVDVYQRLGMPTRAESLLNNIAERPDQLKNPSLLLLRAQFRMDAHDYTSARNLANLALKLAEQKDQANRDKARRLLKLIDVAQGRAAPTDLDGQGNMGEIMVRRRVQELIINDRIDEAIDLLEPIVRNDPKNLDMLARLVQLLIRQGRKDDALAYIKTAQQNDPDNENIRRWQSLLETDEPAQRYTIEMEYASRQDDPFRRAVMQWEIARRYGRTEEAVTFLAKAEEINPGNPVIIEARFRQALQDSDWQEAETIISRVDEQNNIQRELMRGRLAAAREDYESAVTYLQDVLDEKPHLPTPRLLLADCYAAQGQYEKAAEQYRQVIGNNASNIPAMVGLAKVSAAQQRFDEHEKWIRRAYRYPAGKVQPYVKERYLQIALETQDIKQAIDTREKTLAREPGNLENMFRLAALYEQDKQLDKAGQMLQQVYQRSANKIDFAPVLANFYLRMNQSSRADELFTGLLEQVQDPKAKARVYIHYGRFLAGFNPDGAEAMFQKAIQADPDSPAPYQALGDFQAAQAQQLSSQGQSAKARQKWQEAVATLDKAISKDPTNQQAKLVLYRRYIDAGEYDKAIEGYKRLLAESPESLPAQVGMGLAYLRSGRLDEALEHFDEALSINPNSADALVFRSEVYRSRGQLLQASEDMQKAAKFSSSAVLRMDLGRLYQAMGKLNAAAQEYDRVIVKQPDYFPAYQALLELFAQRERWSAVMNLAAQAREQFPRSAFFPMMLARAHKAQGQTAQFIQLLEEAVKLEPQNPNIVLNYLNGLLEAGKYDQLREEAKKYQDTPPYQAAVATLLAQARARQDGPQQAWPMFLSALKNSANPANLFNTIGRMKGIYSPAVLIERFDQIRSTQPDNWRMDMILGDLYMDVQQPAQAEQAYLKAQQAAESNSDKLLLTLRLARVYEVSGQWAKTEQCYKTILKANPANVMALNNLAYLYADKLDRPDEARTLIERALRRNPGNANLMDTYAWALAKSGRYQEALEAFNNIARLDSIDERAATSVDTLYHMGFVHEKLGDSRAAKGYYQRAMELIRDQDDHPLYPTLSQALARIDS